MEPSGAGTVDAVHSNIQHHHRANQLPCPGQWRDPRTDSCRVDLKMENIAAFESFQSFHNLISLFISEQ